MAVAWTELSRAPTVENFQRLVVGFLRDFCKLQIDGISIGEGLLNPFKSAGDVVEQKYAQHLFPQRLDQLPDSPQFIFNATNLKTGRSFRFSKPYMGDYRIGLIRNPTVPVAKAVAASSAFPPFLSPIILDNPGQFEAVEGSDLNGKPEYTQQLYLSDGGVYDNLGLETVWNRCSTVLVSDAGAPFGIGDQVQTDWIKQTLRALDVATDQSRGLRKRALIDDYRRAERKGSYWGISTDIASYQLADSLQCDNKIVQPLSAMRTRLNPFDDREQEQLINWGYALCDAAIRKHVPEIIMMQKQRSWPCPGHPLG